MAKISAEEIKVLARYIYNISGIYLDESKDYLLETRLKPLLGEYGCQDYSELYYKAKSQPGGELEHKIIDAISTNETLFFRDTKPFELLQFKIIPDLIDLKSRVERGQKKTLRFWSAACSTGQEVYSIGITLYEMGLDMSKYQVTILGTDISEEAVAKASYGKYNRFEIERGMPRNILQKYFTPTGDGWRIKDSVRMLANFKKMNLMEPFYGIGPFDVVFCRNVAIYFSNQDKRKLFQKIGRVLEKYGYLIIGGSESLSGIAPQFESKNYLRGVYYQHRDAAQAVEKLGAAGGLVSTGIRKKDSPPKISSPRPRKEARPAREDLLAEKILAAKMSLAQAKREKPPDSLETRSKGEEAGLLISSEHVLETVPRGPASPAPKEETSGGILAEPAITERGTDENGSQLAEKPELGKPGQKVVRKRPFLQSIQEKKQAGKGPLVLGKQSSEAGKGSLLNKLAQRKKKQN